MSNLRIEFTERFLNMTDEEIETANNLKQKLNYSFRLVYPRLDDIDYPREIPGKEKFCEIVYYDGSISVIKGSYQDTCLLIDEREKLRDQREYEE
jgi:hypothetical protein